jgi:hypothetical protein
MQVRTYIRIVVIQAYYNNSLKILLTFFVSHSNINKVEKNTKKTMTEQNNQALETETFLLEHLGSEVTVTRNDENKFYAEDETFCSSDNEKTKAAAIARVIISNLHEMEAIPPELAKLLTGFYLPGVNLE